MTENEYFRLSDRNIQYTTFQYIEDDMNVYMSMEAILGKLNELAAENELLTSDNQDLRRELNTIKEEGYPAEHENKKLKIRIAELEYLLKLISDIDTPFQEYDVKELIRHEIRGLDSVSGEFSGAWKDYLILSKFFKEHYKEDWDNDD